MEKDESGKGAHTPNKGHDFGVQNSSKPLYVQVLLGAGVWVWADAQTVSSQI